MSTVGIYEIRVDEIHKDEAERLYRRQAAYDMEAEAWTPTSNPSFSERFDPETLASLETPEEVLDEFQDKISIIDILVFPTDDVPGEVEIIGETDDSPAEAAN